MNLLTLRAVGTALAATGTALAAIAACSSDSGSLPSTPDASSGGSSGSSSNGSSGSGGSADSDLPDGDLVGAGIDAGLVTYDGPASMIADSSVGCATPDGLPIRFNPMYSGYDGTHDYRVPAFVPDRDPSTLTWSANDLTMVDIQPYPGRPGIMISTKKPGDVTIVAFVTGSTTCGTAPLHIAQYTVDEWNLGNARYNNGNPLAIDPDAGFGSGPPDGAKVTLDGSNLCAMYQGVTNAFENPPAACTNCHGSSGNGKLFGMTLFSDVQHTPEQTGGFSEDDLINAYVHGTIPDGGYFDDSITPYCFWHQVHTWWDVDTLEKQRGMNAYLRSMTPQEQSGCYELFFANKCSDGGLGTGTGVGGD